MLAAVGAASVDDLFADIPARPAPGARPRPAGRLLGERGRGGAAERWPAANSAGRRPAVLSRRRRLRPLRAGRRRRRHVALGVPDRLHALPARAQPGRPAVHLRVPDGHLRDHRPGRQQRVALRRRHGRRRGRLSGARPHRAGQGRGLARRASRVPAGALHGDGRLRRRPACGPAPVEVDSVGGVTSDGRPARRRGRSDRRRHPAQPNFFGGLEDMAQAAQIAHDAGALFVAVVDPISLGVLQPPGPTAPTWPSATARRSARA